MKNAELNYWLLSSPRGTKLCQKNQRPCGSPQWRFLVILAFFVFDWSTRVTDGQTELRWHMHALSIRAVAHTKMEKSVDDDDVTLHYIK